MGFFSELFKKETIPHYFPYSSDIEERRNQVWDNLQKGLLLEDKKAFIPWDTNYWKIWRISVKRHNGGDRITWYLGERKILNGLTCHIEVTKWSYHSNFNPFDQIHENLGNDEDGNKRFLNRIHHITELLGNPQKTELTKFGSFDIGVVEWVRDKVQISIVGVEIFNCRYSLQIGLIDNYHARDLKITMDDLKSQGFTEEDFGK